MTMYTEIGVSRLKKIHNPVVSLTFTGTYATSEYFTKDDCGTAMLPDGRVVLYMKNGTGDESQGLIFASTQYTIENQSNTHHNYNPSGYYYFCIISGITEDTDLTITMNNVSSTSYHTNCQITGTVSNNVGVDVEYDEYTTLETVGERNADFGSVYDYDACSVAWGNDKIITLFSGHNSNDVMDITYQTNINVSIIGHSIHKGRDAGTDLVGIILTKPSHTCSISLTGFTDVLTVTGTTPLTGIELKEFYCNVPINYTELDYIESTGTQYIDMGVVPSSTIRIVLDFQLLSDNGDENQILGYDNSGDPRFHIFVKNSKLYIAAASSANSNKEYDCSQLMKQRCSIDFYDNTLLFNGDVYATNSSLGSDWDDFTDETMWLFSANDSNYTCSVMRVYSCKIYDGSTLVRDFVPCITPKGEIGLLDKVNRKFYSNSGTGTFIAGNTIGVGTLDNVVQVPVYSETTTNITDDTSLNSFFTVQNGGNMEGSVNLKTFSWSNGEYISTVSSICGVLLTATSDLELTFDYECSESRFYGYLNSNTTYKVFDVNTRSNPTGTLTFSLKSGECISLYSSHTHTTGVTTLSNIKVIVKTQTGTTIQPVMSQISSLYTKVDGAIVEIFTGTKKVHNPVTSLTFTGTYATSSYFTEADCGTAILPDGRVVLYMKNGTNSDYENLYFNSEQYNIEYQTHYTNNSNSTERYYFCVISDITEDTDLTVEFGSRNSSTDYILLKITGTTSNSVGSDIVYYKDSVYMTDWVAPNLIAYDDDKLILLTFGSTKAAHASIVLSSDLDIELIGHTYREYSDYLFGIVITNPNCAISATLNGNNLTITEV